MQHINTRLDVGPRRADEAGTYEGALSFVTTTCSYNSKSTYKMRMGRQNNKRPSSKAGGERGGGGGAPAASRRRRAHGCTLAGGLHALIPFIIINMHACLSRAGDETMVDLW
jgi:hypothetical protein